MGSEPKPRLVRPPSLGPSTAPWSPSGEVSTKPDPKWREKLMKNIRDLVAKAPSRHGVIMEMKKETDGNQAATQSSGHNRGSAAQKSNVHSAISSLVESEPQLLEEGERMRMTTDNGASLLPADPPASPTTTEALPYFGVDVFKQSVNHETILQLTNIRVAVARARAYGHSATPHPPERVIARKDELLDQALVWLAEMGLGGSVLREAVGSGNPSTDAEPRASDGQERLAQESNSHSVIPPAQPEQGWQLTDVEAKFAELISTELDHYAQKIAKRVLRKALGGKIAEREQC